MLGRLLVRRVRMGAVAVAARGGCQRAIVFCQGPFRIAVE